MFNVLFVNHDYFASNDFASFEDAVAYAKRCGFEATIIKPYIEGNPYKGGEVVGSWSPINGLNDRRSV